MLESLLDKSLLLRRNLESEWRVDMLTTIRQYALEKLRTSGEYETIRHRHLQTYLQLATEGAPYLGTFGQMAWLDRFDWEHDNFKHALAWAIGEHTTNGETIEPDKREPNAWSALANSAHDPNTGFALLSALCSFWLIRSYWPEGYYWIQVALAQRSIHQHWMKPAQIARIDLMAGLFLPRGEASIGYLEKALAGYRNVEDEEKAAMSLQWLIHTHLLLRNFALIPPLAHELEAFTQRIQHPLLLIMLGRVAFVAGNTARAQVWFEEAKQLAQRQQNQVAWVYALCMNGLLRVGKGEGTSVEAELYEALNQSRQFGRKDLVMYLLGGLSEIALQQGDGARVFQWAAQALPLASELNHQASIATHFLHCASILAQKSRKQEAATLLCVAQTLIRALPTSPEHLSLATYHRALSHARITIDAASCTSSFDTPHAITSEDGISSILTFAQEIGKT